MSNLDLLLSSYDYDLPAEQIAKRPASPRHDSKLLVYDESSDTITHDIFLNLDQYLDRGSELVLNKSKVFPCRLLGEKDTGAKVEVFILSLTPTDLGHECLIKSSSKKKVGDRYLFDGFTGTLAGHGEQGTFFIQFNQGIEEVLGKGNVPIPPYIRDGVSDEQDKADYQTIYAANSGSVAAPTAGLHFTQEVFDRLDIKGIGRSFVTLHVGLGTFAPVKAEDISQHKMHTENFFVEKREWSQIKKASKRFAVGTTSLRVLESLWNEENIEEGKMYETDIFLHPGVPVQSIDGLITNFHLPGSTLIMLVASLIGREKTLEIYKVATEQGYRFFSYGDAMLILRKGQR